MKIKNLAKKPKNGGTPAHEKKVSSKDNKNQKLKKSPLKSLNNFKLLLLKKKIKIKKLKFNTR